MDTYTVTVKASNFGPHINVGLFFQNGLLSSKRFLQNEENETCGTTEDFKIRLCSFLAHNSSKEATELARKGPKFP